MSSDAPSPEASRPFGLTLARPSEPLVLPAGIGYDLVRQIGVDAGGVGFERSPMMKSVYDTVKTTTTDMQTWSDNDTATD